MSPFGVRLHEALRRSGPLCVGIDPHAALLDEWGLADTDAGVREFGLRVVEAAAGHVGVVKPQVSFFERHGSKGIAALEDVMASARSAGLLVIADAKRGDIGTTMSAYADAWLGAGSPLEADALTVNPFLGPDSLAETFDRALAGGKGIFVLAATSNPSAAVVQSARDESATAGYPDTVSGRVAHDVRDRARGSRAGDLPGSADAPLASLGLVVGATVDRAQHGLTDEALTGLPILAPGFGAQGAVPGDLTKLFGAAAAGVVASESRSVLAGDPALLAERIERRRDAYGAADV